MKGIFSVVKFVCISLVAASLPPLPPPDVEVPTINVKIKPNAVRVNGNEVDTKNVDIKVVNLEEKNGITIEEIDITIDDAATTGPTGPQPGPGPTGPAGGVTGPAGGGPATVVEEPCSKKDSSCCFETWKNVDIAMGQEEWIKEHGTLKLENGTLWTSNWKNKKWVVKGRKQGVWSKRADRFKLTCRNGKKCNYKKRGWGCCKNKGGRKQCPFEYPVMCAALKCDDLSDYCCSQIELGCAVDKDHHVYGGPRSKEFLCSCMVDGKDGDGTAQGTCLAGTLCHADGKCKAKDDDKSQ